TRPYTITSIDEGGSVTRTYDGSFCNKIFHVTRPWFPGSLDRIVSWSRLFLDSSLGVGHIRSTRHPSGISGIFQAAGQLKR
ncbi:MAG TPA: hypothetical protein PLL69_02745, partial [Gemmatimonadales bacterium]|nr:hypothetical protein [Gemmatimonadales bacterium]